MGRSGFVPARPFQRGRAKAAMCNSRCFRAPRTRYPGRAAVHTRTRGCVSLPRSRFRQFHSTLELRWLVILDAEIGVIQRSDPFYLMFGELWAFRTRREFGELLFIVNVRER